MRPFKNRLHFLLKRRAFICEIEISCNFYGSKPFYVDTEMTILEIQHKIQTRFPPKVFPKGIFRNAVKKRE
jgi:hypothetical protein